MAVPKVIAWDLDGCVWDPEMYQLWGGGSPFNVAPGSTPVSLSRALPQSTVYGCTAGKGGDLVDNGGTNVRLLGDVRNIMRELKTDPQWANTIVACASCCDEPAWARECIQKFELGDGLVLGDVISIEEIYKGNKVRVLTVLTAPDYVHYAHCTHCATPHCAHSTTARCARRPLSAHYALPAAARSLFLLRIPTMLTALCSLYQARDHITTIAKKANCQPEEIIFLDNEKGNCKTVAGIGCTVGYTPSGVTREAWEATLEAFPAPGEIINSR